MSIHGITATACGAILRGATILGEWGDAHGSRTHIRQEQRCILKEWLPQPKR
ncbi:hypothetical protein [Acidithiobacillus thiooxidans]|uniref:hypothetical protein n=1 Tax=Acidithiobacillus thiooxidans TaxID=930 RepID=UPI0013150BDC|nr:hypothetical protein [Acidithiobacillus thiooxidans]